MININFLNLISFTQNEMAGSGIIMMSKAQQKSINPFMKIIKMENKYLKNDNNDGDCFVQMELKTISGKKQK